MAAKALTQRQQHWLKHIKASEEFEGSVADYARSQQLSIRDIYNWRNKLAKLGLWQSADQPSNFVAVSPTLSETTRAADPIATKRQSGCTVTLDNGVRIDFHGELSPGVIRSIMSTVSQSH